MKINLNEIKTPLEKKVTFNNGEVEISLSAMDEKSSNVYKTYMKECAVDDKMFVDTSDMDKESTMKACGGSFEKMKAMLMEESNSGGLTPGQKKLPPALQKAILKKMGENVDEEDSDHEKAEKAEKDAEE
jgi:hypothetical protein